MNIFKPTWMIERIYNLSPKELKDNGVKAVLTDLDNTLIAWNNPYGTPELKRWLKDMSANGIEVIVVSNNSYQRVETAVESFGVKFEARALKPLSVGINRALRKNNLAKAEVIMVGDQYVTDMVAANRIGIRTVLVKPLVKSDAWNTKFNRFLEHFIKHGLKKKYPNLKWSKQIGE